MQTTNEKRGGARILVREEDFWGRHRGGSGSGAPRSPANFWKFSKQFIRKLKVSMHSFQKIANHALTIRTLGRNAQMFGKFWDILKGFMEIQWKKLNFLLFLEIVLLKIRSTKKWPSQRERGDLLNFPPFPLATPLSNPIFWFQIGSLC